MSLSPHVEYTILYLLVITIFHSVTPQALIQFCQHGLVLKLELFPRILSLQISFSTTLRSPHDNGRIYTSDER